MKPILFNTEMVKAILNGSKTQFRKTAKDKISLSLIGNYKENNLIDISINNKYISDDIIKRSEYKVDDILYVKETFNDEGWEDQEPLLFKADIEEKYLKQYWWKPSIHMPKKYARIFLKVINVRVERLQDITLTDRICEGINHLQEYSTGKVVKPFTQIKREFINLWNSTAKDGYKWEDNPYVFVYEFERIEKQHDQ